MENFPLEKVKGLGPVRVKKLAKLGVSDTTGLLRLYPRRYEDRTKIVPLSEAVPGEMSSVVLEVTSPVKESFIRRGMTLYKLRACDDSGVCEITYFNNPYVKRALVTGKKYLFYGRLSPGLYRREMTSPVFEPVTEGKKPGSIVPVYPLCEGLTQRIVASAVAEAFRMAGELEDPLGPQTAAAYGLCRYPYALKNIHRPSSAEALELARRRLVFDELFLFQLGVIALRQKNRTLTGARMQYVPPEDFFAKLPFAPTGAQRRAVEEIEHDMCAETPMNRLVQGDVGCGKTMVAAAAAYIAVKNGCQAVMMAPTEILARQHYESLAPLLERCGIRSALLTGGMGAARRRQVLADIGSGAVGFVCGTHALLEEDVVFARLGLVVTDEQHRFGVRQRATLAAKGEHPHICIMSATPIPRTLALILYGDLDVSIIDELPPGRQKVDTFCVNESYRQRLNGFIRRLCGEGRQVYVVCPLVEEGEDGEQKSAVQYAEKLSKTFPELTIGHLHGRMKGREKEEIMGRFAAGAIQVLVSTTVIEVGVNVPNAALMVVENAERFGLSQLHQLRGRVGRGEHKSYCVLVSSTGSETTRRRLEVMCRTNDGFEIAEQDLALRGPGDFFGDRQHGLPEFRLADIAGDMEILELARRAAEEVLTDDPLLEKPEHVLLCGERDRLFAETGGVTG